MATKRCCCTCIPFRRAGGRSSPTANNSTIGASQCQETPLSSTIVPTKSEGKSTIESNPGASQCQETPLSSTDVPLKSEGDSTVESGPGASQCQEIPLSSTNVPSKSEGEKVDVNPNTQGVSKCDEGSSSSSSVPIKSEGENVEANLNVPGASQTDKAASSSGPTKSDVAKTMQEKYIVADERGNVNVNLDELMEHISLLLKLIEKDNGPHKKPTIPNIWTYSSDWKNLYDLLSSGVERLSALKDVISGPVKEILKGMGYASLATTGLLFVVYSLERYEELSSNKEECLSLLKEMCRFVDVVKRLKESPEGLQNIIEDATALIIEGAIMCCSQIDSSPWKNFFKAPINKADLSGINQKLHEMCSKIDLQVDLLVFKDVRTYGPVLKNIQTYGPVLNDVQNTTRRILTEIEHKTPPLSIKYPTDAVGIEESVKEVLHLLECESEQKAVTVILHGFGGMGKTTLADAVFSQVGDGGRKYSKVELFTDIDSKPDIKKLQRKILEELMGPGKTIPEFTTDRDGQRELAEVLREVHAFIYIDNALKRDALTKLLPQNMDTATNVRLLVTTRDENVKFACPNPKIYHMKGIQRAEAILILKKKIKEGINDNLFNDIVRICGEIPLMLTLAAAFIGGADDKLKAYDRLMQDQGKWENESFHEMHCAFAYDAIPKNCRDPFLDICSYFKGRDWDTVADIVGQEVLESLASRALVTKDANGNASVHDVILSLACQKSKEESQGKEVRLTFTTEAQLEEFLEEKDIEGIKGIWVSADDIWDCGVDELKGKTILLEIRHTKLSYDIRVQSLKEMYDVVEKEKLALEIISIPIYQPSRWESFKESIPIYQPSRWESFEESRESGAYEQFLKEIPWLVFIERNSRKEVIRRVLFLAKKCGWKECDEYENWYPTINLIIDPCGKVIIYNSSTIMPTMGEVGKVLSNYLESVSYQVRWGAKVCPIMDEKIEKLNKEEWKQLKNMSTLEFLFSHLERVSSEVKKLMFHKNIICLCSHMGLFCLQSLVTKNDGVHIICIPEYDARNMKRLQVTYATCKYFYYSLPDWNYIGLRNIGLLRSDEALRFWMRILYLKEEINGMDESDEQLWKLKCFLQSFQFLLDKDKFKAFAFSLPLDTENNFMTFMNKDGKIIATCDGEIVYWIYNSVIHKRHGMDKREQLLQQLIKNVEKGNETHGEDSSISHSLTKNIQTAVDASEQKNVDVDLDLDILGNYIQELLLEEQLYHFFKTNKERKKWSQPKAIWPTSEGFRMLKDFLLKGINVNWVQDIISGNEEDKWKTVTKRLLKDIGQTQWAAAGLLMVADVLERFNTVSTNQNLCLFLLDEMYRMALYLKKKFNEKYRLPTWMKREATGSIVIGSIMCCAQIDPSKFAVFIDEPVDEKMLRAFLEELELKCNGMVHALSKGLKKFIYEEYSTGQIRKDPRRIFNLLADFIIGHLEGESGDEGGSSSEGESGDEGGSSSEGESGDEGGSSSKGKGCPTVTIREEEEECVASSPNATHNNGDGQPKVIVTFESEDEGGSSSEGESGDEGGSSSKGKGCPTVGLSLNYLFTGGSSSKSYVDWICQGEEEEECVASSPNATHNNGDGQPNSTPSQVAS